jgi:hypothetical protein
MDDGQFFSWCYQLQISLETPDFQKDHDQAKLVLVVSSLIIISLGNLDVKCFTSTSFLHSVQSVTPELQYSCFLGHQALLKYIIVRSKQSPLLYSILSSQAQTMRLVMRECCHSIVSAGYDDIQLPNRYLERGVIFGYI